MFNDGLRNYILEGLRATPVVLGHLLEDVEEGVWDRRPDPDRFTLREVMAHLADWETIWLERVEKLCAEEDPVLPGRDPEQLALEHDYANANVPVNLQRFQEGRKQLVERIARVEPEEWTRRGRHEELGPITVQSLAQIVVSHDGYHLRQVVEWTG